MCILDHDDEEEALCAHKELPHSSDVLEHTLLYVQ